VTKGDQEHTKKNCFVRLSLSEKSACGVARPNCHTLQLSPVARKNFKSLHARRHASPLHFPWPGFNDSVAVVCFLPNYCTTFERCFINHVINGFITTGAETMIFRFMTSLKKSKTNLFISRTQSCGKHQKVVRDRGRAVRSL